MATLLAVVLGAGPQIGLSVGRRFAEGGCRVAMVGLDAGPLETVALPGSEVFVADLARPGAVADVFWRIRERMGEAGVLVYNASGGTRGTASSLPPEALARDLRVNALAPLEAVREVLPAMRKAGKGTLLFTGGGLALKPQVDAASASMGKAALRQLALCLAEELAPAGIHAATVTVAGFVQPGTAFGPDRIAEHFWELHAEPRERWRSEVVVRP